MNLDTQKYAIEHAIQFLSNDYHFPSQGAKSEAAHIVKRLTDSQKDNADVIHNLNMAILLLTNYRSTFKPSQNGFNETSKVIDFLNVFVKEI